MFFVCFLFSVVFCLFVHIRACVCKELLLKDEECERLSKVRDQLGQELEELTASLFQVGPPLLPPSCPPPSPLPPVLLIQQPDRDWTKGDMAFLPSTSFSSRVSSHEVLGFCVCLLLF